MGSLQRFKEYLGLVPVETVDDDYLDEAEVPLRSRRYDDRGLPDRQDQHGRPVYDEPGEPLLSGRQGMYTEFEDNRFTYGRSRSPRPPAGRLDPLPADRSALSGRVPGGTRGAGQVGKNLSTSRISTIKPESYSQAGVVGNRFREGNAVVVNLSEVSTGDAVRFVDFAAGLVFMVNGSLEKMANRVFLLSPPNAVISSEDRERIERELHSEGK